MICTDQFGVKPMMEINKDFSVVKGDSLDFQDTSGFHFNAGSVSNQGTINVHGTGDLWDFRLCGGFGNGRDSDGLFWNQHGGHFRVVATGEGMEAYGYLTVSWGPDFKNDGVFLVQNKLGSAWGVAANSPGMSFVNNGSLQVSGESAGGVALSNGGSYVNTGSITIHGGSSAVGLWVDYGGDNVENSGSITVVCDTQTSYGMRLEGAILENSGVVTADYALWSDSGGNTITNTGSLIGAVTLNGIGNILHNSGKIEGNLTFGQGSDVYDGTGGRINGTVFGGTGDDILTGSGKADVLYGDGSAASKSDGNDVLSGGKGVDHLFGENGKDVLIGGAGGGILSGGARADAFVFLKVTDSTTAHTDLITDLTADDRIDLSAIDANTVLKGDQAFTLVASLDGHAGQLVLSFDANGDVTSLIGDVDGDGQADFVVRLTGDQTAFNHFVL
jgi:Ca2+-binding RTX toxin-like protein